MRLAASSAGFDAFPITTLTTASRPKLSEAVGVHVEPARFRPSVLLSEAETHEEDSWERSLLRVVEVSLLVRSVVPAVWSPASIPRLGPETSSCCDT